MRNIHWVSAFTAVLIAGLLPAAAQNSSKAPPSAAPAKPYKPVAITPPGAMTDAAFESLRQQLAEAAKKRDRAALAKLVAAQGFFWERENGEGADKRKTGIDNLSAALGLNNKDSAGWDMLTGYADDPTASPSPGHKGAVCAPADPAYNAKEFDELTKATQTDASEWAYTVSPNTDVLAKAQPEAALVDKLGPAFVRVLPDNVAISATYVRVITPSGKAGYVPVDAIAPIGNDQLCYVKDAGGWKIGGYIGGGEP